MNAPRQPELAKAYEPDETESAVSRRWREAHAFHAEPDDPGDPYSIVIPPPNVTAPLHLGHALNNTLQDVLTRLHRMRGFNTLWMPGTDHAGIATQTVVEKRLLAQGTSRIEIGREAFVDTVQQWKDEYEAVILAQLDEIGASCDWDRTRFTMDPVCVAAVRQAFFQLFSDGLIYRGKRLVNWDPVSRTALADDEVEMEDVDGHMWYLQYPLTDGSGHLTVATTRPETMLGDTAVAVNPADPRAEALMGKTVTLPIVGRVIPVVLDDYVVLPDPEGDAKARMATGFLKVTPAHDPNDYEIGRRHDLPVINVMAPDGSISDQYGWDDAIGEAGPLVGLSREEARAGVVAWFDERGLLEDVRDHPHSVGHSYRSHVPIEPYLSDQWYVAVTDDRLRGEALRAMAPDQRPETMPDGIASPGDHAGDGGLRFHPDRYARTFASWHETIRDWCISRQLWWGHRIPVWTRIVPLADAAAEVADALAGAEIDVAVPVAASTWSEHGGAHVARRLPDDMLDESVCVPAQITLDRAGLDQSEAQLIAALEAEGFAQDPDVLDTWFSSALWPLSTMGWPDPERFDGEFDTAGLLDRYVPTSVLMTARDIMTLWVSRMVMFARYFHGGQLPFRDVFIHVMIQDGHGQRMSKSLGNGVDPRDIIHSHGADAMRFTLAQMSTSTQDVRMPVEMICAHSGQAFEPETITTTAGHIVAAPTQTSPADPAKTMVSAYGVAAGVVEPTEQVPLARNTSSKFDIGRNFANKLWNATRFTVGSLGPADQAETPADPVTIADRPMVDRWVLSRLATTVDELVAAADRYHFNVIADTIYSVVWRDVCDWYLEAVKPTVRDDLDQQVVLGHVFDVVMRIVHPVCPFVTEALWPHVSEVTRGDVAGIAVPPSDVLATAPWPVFDAALVDREAEAAFARVQTLVGAIRNLRGERNVAPRRKITLHAPPAVMTLVAEAEGVVQTLAGLGEVHEWDGAERPAGASAIPFEGAEVLVSGLVDQADADSERSRLSKVIAELTKQIGGLEGRLANESYVAKAPSHLVQETRDSLEAAQADLAAAETALTALK
jgi:valyl-tRNA synthetase